MFSNYDNSSFISFPYSEKLLGCHEGNSQFSLDSSPNLSRMNLKVHQAPVSCLCRSTTVVRRRNITVVYSRFTSSRTNITLGFAGTAFSPCLYHVLNAVGAENNAAFQLGWFHSLCVFLALEERFAQAVCFLLVDLYLLTFQPEKALHLLAVLDKLSAHGNNKNSKGEVSRCTHMPLISTLTD